MIRTRIAAYAGLPRPGCRKKRHLADIGGGMSEPGAPVPLEKREQLALLREKRAAEQCERLKARCKTQASLMCRLFATKLQEQQAAAVVDPALRHFWTALLKGGKPRCSTDER